MNNIRFTEAYNKVMFNKQKKDGIGTLSEKSLHAIIKNYLEPDESKQEIKIGKNYADIYNEEGIIEIQTRQFNKLRNKLTELLKYYKVKVVYPIPFKKWIFWVNDETSEISRGRKSPKTGTVYDAFFEFYKIKALLNNSNLSLKIILLDAEEYRHLNGWSKDKKKGSCRMDIIPKRIENEIDICTVHDYKKLIPKGLDNGFTSRDFAKEANINIEKAQITLNILYEVKAVERIGKSGKSYLYTIK